MRALLGALFVSILFSLSASAALKISLITVSPGPVIFEAFGHSAILVENSEDAADVRVYEYGNVDTMKLFRQSDPLLALNMLFTETVKTTGKKATSSPLMKTGFSAGLPIDFHVRYFREKTIIREIMVNELDLTEEQKTKLLVLIEAEMPPYEYEYKRFTDNCVTRIRDNIFKVLGEAVSAKLDESAGNLTYREILVDSLNAGAKASVEPAIMIFTPAQAKTPSAKKTIQMLAQIGLPNEIKAAPGKLPSDAFFEKITDADKKIASYAMFIDGGAEMSANFHDYFLGEDLTKEGMNVRTSLFTPKRLRDYLLGIGVIGLVKQKTYTNAASEEGITK